MFYRAIVTDNQDPSKSGKCQLKIIGLNDGGNVWAERAGSTDFGLNNGIGVSSTLQIGTWVWVFLDHDNPNKPVIFATIIDSGDFHANAAAQYGKTQTIKTSSGHLIEFGDASGDSKISITHSAGTKVSIDNSGNVNVDCVGNVVHNISGSVTFTCGGDFKVTAPAIRLN